MHTLKCKHESTIIYYSRALPHIATPHRRTGEALQSGAEVEARAGELRGG